VVGMVYWLAIGPDKREYVITSDATGWRVRRISSMVKRGDAWLIVATEFGRNVYVYWREHIDGPFANVKDFHFNGDAVTYEGRASAASRYQRLAIGSMD